MFNKTIIICIVVLIFVPIEIGASAGRLIGSSIVTCNGNSYGKHGDGHYHKAKNTDNGWYPEGDFISQSNPCKVSSSGGSGGSGGNSSVQEKPNTVPKKTQEQINAEKAEAKRLEEAEAKRLEEIELKRLEEIKRLEQEELERKKVLEDVSISYITYNGIAVPETIVNFDVSKFFSNANK